MGRWKPLALVLPLLLWGCIYEPGKFMAALDIGADRSFTFSYTGEVIAAEPSMPKSDEAEDKAETAAAKAERDTELRAVAEALRKEPGIVKADYVGDRVFMIDYRTKGVLTHAFAFPFNIDAKMLLPFVAVELRGRDGVRVMAPGFATDNKDEMSAVLPTGTKGASRLDGTFVLSTDAEIVSQNHEGGVTTSATGRKVVSWRVNALTKDAPMAVLKVAGLP